MGSARPELNAATRIIIEGRYIAIYEPTDYGAEIVVVVHGMREPSSWLD
jgi:plasmid stabilization system protein ParE